MRLYHGDYALQIFPGMLPWENNNAFDVNDYKFWSGPNPWQFIFEGYKSGVAPGKQGVQVGEKNCQKYTQFGSKCGGYF